MNNKTQPTPEQLAKKWYKEGLATFLKDKHSATFNSPEYFYAAGYLRAKQEDERSLKDARKQALEEFKLLLTCSSL